MRPRKRHYRFGRFLFDEERRDLQLDGVPLPARSQALDLLAALLAKPGTLLSKDDLMKAAWLGVHVEEGNISVQVHYLRQLLQDSEKPYRWIATEPGRGYRFVGVLEAEPGGPDGAPAPVVTAPDGAPAPVVTAIDSALPGTSGPLIGRERELAALLAKMPRHRLVTVTGAGGMGKTRLAIEFAREHAADPLNKTLFLGLEGLRQKDQISFRLAGRLGVQPAEGPQMAHVLADALQKQGYLIIFDNCEHVLDEVANLAETILRHAPGVSILATSREPLKIADEYVFALGPLEFPASGAALSTLEIEGYTAVRLFTDKAQASDPGFRLNDETSPDIAAICAKMEGIPLALQLAAARLDARSLPQLLRDISASRRLAPAALPGIPARHRTVEATIAWSVSLLTETERAALRRLSIFPNRFTVEGAAAVIAGGLIKPANAADLLRSLCDKSLLIMSSTYNDPPRFRLLESTRDFGRGLLAQAGEAASRHQALATYMVAVFGRARDLWPDSRADAWAATFEPDIETLRAALDWAFSPEGDRAVGVALAARLRGLASDRLITQREFLSATGQAVAALEPGTPAADRGWVLMSASADYAVGPERCVSLAAAAIESFRQHADPSLVGFSAARAAVVHALFTGAQISNPYRDDALAALAQVPASRYRSAVLLNLATSYGAGQSSEGLQLALQYYEQALPIAQAFNDRAQIALIGANLAELEANLGHYDAAIERATTMARQNRLRRDWHRLSHDLLNLVQYNLLADRVHEARQAAAEAIQLLMEFEDEHWGADYGGRFAMLTALSGDVRAAAKLAGFSDQYFVAQNKRRQVVDQRLWDRLTVIFDDAATSGVLPAPERVKLFKAGETLSLTDVLTIARGFSETFYAIPA